MSSSVYFSLVQSQKMLILFSTRAGKFQTFRRHLIPCVYNFVGLFGTKLSDLNYKAKLSLHVPCLHLAPFTPGITNMSPVTTCDQIINE